MPSSNPETTFDSPPERATTEPVVLGEPLGETPMGPGAFVARRYRVVRALGEGGMGQVFEADHVGLGRSVALKVVRSCSPSGSSTIERFEREARALARLSGPNVVRVFDFGHLDDGRPFLAMELLEGEDLRTRIRRGRVAPRLAIDWVRQACLGLAEAHEAGLVHRDIKPENLFLSPVSEAGVHVRLIDFGIAKDVTPAGRDGSELTASTLLLGSPSYMSPEQLRAPQEVGPATDLWSLGVVLHELLSGALPFVGETDAALVAAIAADRPKPLHASLEPSELRRELEAIVSSCLDKDPLRRPASARALAAKLERIARDSSPSPPRRAWSAAASVLATTAAVLGVGWILSAREGESVQPATHDPSGPFAGARVEAPSVGDSSRDPEPAGPADPIEGKRAPSVLESLPASAPRVREPRALASGHSMSLPARSVPAARASASAGTAPTASPLATEARIDRAAAAIERRK
jgi:serine/threonine protein kinase